MSSQYSEQKNAIPTQAILILLRESWRRLAIASFIGAVLGFVGWNFLGAYATEYLLLNTSKEYSESFGMTEWKVLKAKLPVLAGQIIDHQKVPEHENAIYMEMKNNQWWQKNVRPIYSLSKSEARELASVSGSQTGAANSILGLAFMVDGRSEEQSIKNAYAAVNFFRTGGAYFYLLTLVNNYLVEVAEDETKINQKVLLINENIRILKNRLKKYEELSKRYPQNNSPVLQVVNDSEAEKNAKYLPIQSQIIALHSDIANAQESLLDAQNKLQGLLQIKKFLEQAIPLQEQFLDGVILCDKLLELELGLRAKLGKDDFGGLQRLNELHSDLLIASLSYANPTKNAIGPYSLGKAGMLKSITVGLVAAILLTFLWLLLPKVLSIKNLKKNSDN